MWHLRNTIVFTLLSFCHSLPTVAQVTVARVNTYNFYPLHLGDRWEYLDIAGFGGSVVDTVIVTADADSIVSDTTYIVKHFRSLHYGYRITHLERVDASGNVFGRFEGDISERLLHRLNDTTQSWWSSGSDYRRFDSTSLTVVFGSARVTIGVLSYSPSDTVHPTSREALCDGIGSLGWGGPEGSARYLRGAKINGVEFGIVTSVREDQLSHTAHYADLKAYPNPFNASVTIDFTTRFSETIDLAVWNLAGQRLATLASGAYPIGRHIVHWDAHGFTSGIYFIVLRTTNDQIIQRIVMLK